MHDVRPPPLLLLLLLLHTFTHSHISIPILHTNENTHKHIFIPQLSAASSSRIGSRRATYCDPLQIQKSHSLAPPDLEEQTATMSESKGAAPPAAPEATSGGPAKPVYPELPPYMARPDKVQHRMTLDTLDAEIKTLTEKRTKLQTSLRDAEAGGGDVREARSALMVDMRKLTTQAKALRKERGALLDQRNAFRDEQKKTRDQLKKMRDELGKHSDLASIETAIQRLHYRQSTGSMSLNEEKKMMAELAALNKMKGSVAVYAEMAAQEKKKFDGGRGINDLLTAKTAEVQAVSNKISKVKAELDILDAKKDKKRDKVKPLRDEVDKVRAEIDGKYAKLKELRTQWKKDNDAYYDYMKKVKVIKAKIRKIDDEYYKAELAEKRRILEEEEAKMKPWLEEIALCDTLIMYLNGCRPKVVEASREQKAPTAPLSKKQKAMLEGGLCVGLSKSKKKGKKKKRLMKAQAARMSAEQTIRHDMKALGDFAYLAKHSGKPLQIPSNLGDIDATIESLKDIKAYYDVLPRAKKKTSTKKKKKTEGAAVGESLDTPYGTAKVSERREDGVVVASLAWGELYIQM